MLVKIGRWVRGWFGVQAAILVLSALFLAFNVWTMARQNDIDLATAMHFWPRLALVFVLELGIAGISAMAWFTLRAGTPPGRAWAIAASLASLPVAGIGTIAGILGLVVFTRKDVVEKSALRTAQDRPRLPGDGTSRLVDTLTVAAQIVALALANRFWTSWGEDRGLPQLHGWFSFLLQFEVALQGSVLMHELGHVLGGWASHMKLRAFVLGPLEGKVLSGKWTFKFTPVGLWGRGSVGMVPAAFRDLRGQRVFMTLGGPVGSLLAGCLGLIGALSAQGQPWESWWGCFTMLATLGLSGFVVNLVPLRPENQYSDGAHLYQLLSGGRWADVHIAMSLAGATLVTPLRPRDFDPRMLDRAAAFLRHGKEGFLLRLFQYMHYVDAGDVGRGMAALAEAEALYPELAPGLQAELHMDFVFANAIYRRDVEAARMWWQRAERKGMKRFNVDYWKARTALLWLEGMQAQAEESWKKGNAVAQALPKAGGYDFDRWGFTVLRDALDGKPVQSLNDVPPPFPQVLLDAPGLADAPQFGGGWVPLENAGVAG